MQTDLKFLLKYKAILTKDLNIQYILLEKALLKLFWGKNMFLFHSPGKLVWGGGQITETQAGFGGVGYRVTQGYVVI